MSFAKKFSLIAVVLLVVALPEQALAQINYICQPKVIQVEQPVTKTKLVKETTYEQVPVTEQVPVITTETRYRKTTTYRPVVKNKILEERYEVQKPVAETSYKEYAVEETAMEEVTEIRKHQVVVEKPVTETRMREEQVVVKKPVEKTVYQQETQTTYRPELRSETTYAESDVVISDPNAPAGTRLEWLRRGYYYDATRGAYVYRRPGLHWVNSPTAAVTTQKVLVPQSTLKTVLVPQESTSLKPVTISSVEDVIETRRVPYTVETTQKVVETIDVPVVVKKPVVKHRTERVPVNSTRYEAQEVVRRTPFTETTWQCLEENEPYQVQVQKYVTQTKMVSVPKTVYREIPYQTMETVSKVVMEKIPVDANGCPLPVISSPSLQSFAMPLNEAKDLASSSTISQQSVAKPTLANEPKSFGSFNRTRDGHVLKERRVIDADQETPSADKTETSAKQEKDPSKGASGEPLKSVLTLERKELKPIGERPQPKEADIPPSIEQPKSNLESDGKPSSSTDGQGSEPATKAAKDPDIG
jgi:hypothetical protein